MTTYETLYAAANASWVSIDAARSAIEISASDINGLQTRVDTAMNTVRNANNNYLTAQEV